MNTLVTNKIMSSYSLGMLAAISKLKYFGHTMHSSDSMKKRFESMTDGWQWKTQKTVYKTIC